MCRGSYFDMFWRHSTKINQAEARQSAGLVAIPAEAWVWRPGMKLFLQVDLDLFLTENNFLKKI